MSDYKPKYLSLVDAADEAVKAWNAHHDDPDHGPTRIRLFEAMHILASAVAHAKEQAANRAENHARLIEGALSLAGEPHWRAREVVQAHAYLERLAEALQGKKP